MGYSARRQEYASHDRPTPSQGRRAGTVQRMQMTRTVDLGNFQIIFLLSIFYFLLSIFLFSTFYFLFSTFYFLFLSTYIYTQTSVFIFDCREKNKKIK